LSAPRDLRPARQERCSDVQQGSNGFEVWEQQRGASSLELNYRVVARRKDIPGPRLEKVKLPNPIKELVKPPDPPTIPERPDSRPPSR